MKDTVQLYYIRDPREVKKSPVMCVALSQNPETGQYSRGISLWSEREQFCRAEARKWAIHRCLRAQHTRKAADPIMKWMPGSNVLRGPGVLFPIRWIAHHHTESAAVPAFKSEPDVKLTAFEMQLMANVERFKEKRHAAE